MHSTQDQPSIRQAIEDLTHELSQQMIRMQNGLEASVLRQIHPELTGYLPALALIRLTPRPWENKTRMGTSFRSDAGTNDSQSLLKTLETAAAVPLDVTDVTAGPLITATQTRRLPDARSSMTLRLCRTPEESRPIHEWDDFRSVVLNFAGANAWRCYQEMCLDGIAVLARSSSNAEWHQASLEVVPPSLISEPTLSLPGCRILQEYFHFPHGLLRCVVQLPDTLVQTLDDQLELAVVRSERFTNVTHWHPEQVQTRCTVATGQSEDMQILELPPRTSWAELTALPGKTLHEILHVDMLQPEFDGWVRLPRCSARREGWWRDDRFEAPRLVISGPAPDSERTIRLHMRTGGQTQFRAGDTCLSADQLQPARLLHLAPETELSESPPPGISVASSLLLRGNTQAFRLILETCCGKAPAEKAGDDIVDAVMLTSVSAADWEGSAGPGEDSGWHKGTLFRVTVDESAFPDQSPGLWIHVLDRFFGSLVSPPQFHQLQVQFVRSGRILTCRPRFH